jgi:hypothetical protein
MKHVIFYAQIVELNCKVAAMIAVKIFYYFPVDVPKACGLILASREVRECPQGVTHLDPSLSYCIVTLIVPNIPEHFQCSIIIVTTYHHLRRNTSVTWKAVTGRILHKNLERSIYKFRKAFHTKSLIPSVLHRMTPTLWPNHIPTQFLTLWRRNFFFNISTLCM